MGSEDKTTLVGTEPHPAALFASDYIAQLGLAERMQWLEVFSSLAIEGNRLAEVCAGTLRRIMDREPVSDRYVLGLAWTIRNMKKGESA